MLLLPETPRYLIKMNRHEDAARSLGRIRRLAPDHPAIQSELAEVKANHDFETSLGKASYLDCFRPPILKRQLTGIFLQALQQLTGMFIVGGVRVNVVGFVNPTGQYLPRAPLEAIGLTATN